MLVLKRLKALLSEELLLEAKNIGYLKNKFPKVNNIERYLSFDPTYEGNPDNIGQYSEWIILQVNRGNIKPGDRNKIHELLSDFGMQLKRNTLKGNDRSILSYKTVDDLSNKLDAVKSEGISNKVSAKNVAAKPVVGTEIVYADDDWTIYIPYTYTGSRRAASLGGDRAAWCTANPSNDYYWKSYSSKGPLYIIVNNQNNADKYQVNISFNNSSGKGVLDGHMDRNDYPFNFDAFLADKPEMKKFFDGEYNQNAQDYFDKKNMQEMISFLNNNEADKAITDIKKLIGIIDKGPDRLTEFDEDIFERIVTEITADESEVIQFKLIGGLVIKEKIERKKR